MDVKEAIGRKMPDYNDYPGIYPNTEEMEGDTDLFLEDEMAEDYSS
jgi:hypothetical protein